MNQWQIGKVKVTRIVEMQVKGGTKFILPQATPEAVLPIKWLAPHFMDDKGNLIMSIHALVIDTGDRRIIVDTCIGNNKQRNVPNWNNLQLPFLEDLEKAGYPKDSIDTVLCTHLHVDHVGWNTMLINDKWIPTFPNARYLMGQKEFDYWNAEDDVEKYGTVMDDSVRPVVEAGLAEFVDMDHKICDEVYLEPTTGHTPGHVSVHISSEGQEALITGDCIHHPCQIARLDWSSSADYDPKASQVTRKDLMAQYADRDILIIGTHFATPTAGYFRKTADNTAEEYWFDAKD